MLTIYLVRHGETAWNADGRFQGQQDVSLSERGCQQAQTVAATMTSLPLQAIYTSDLRRSAETAEAIAAPHRLAVIPDRRLREAFFGEWEGLTLPQIAARWPEIVAAWRADSLRTRPPGGETLEQVQARVAEALAAIVQAHPHGTIAIVGHGGSVRAIIATVLGADLSIFRRLRLDNCSISSVRVDDEGRYSLTGMNDICHLGPQAPRATWDEAGDQWRLAMQGPGGTPGKG